MTGDIAWEAVDKAITNDPLTFSAENLSKWDYDNDNQIDTFFVIHAGLGEEEGFDPNDIYSVHESVTVALAFEQTRHHLLHQIFDERNKINRVGPRSFEDFLFGVESL